jgi:uncharacterized protein DUF6352
MPDFWTHCGFNLARRDVDGKLVVTDDLLRAWWRRPEVAIVAESCDVERALHAALLAVPRRAVSAAELAAMQDPAAIENYGVVLALRDRLLAAPTLEAAYLDIFRGGNVTVPPIFIDQLAQMIVRGILDGTGDPLEARAAELFFRTQKVALEDGAVMLADAETVELHESGGAYGDIGRLLVENRTKSRRVDLDVIDAGNADSYWMRDERHDTVVSISYGRAALTAFCHVIEKWVRHFCGVDVAVKPLRTIEDRHWAWHIGLDAEATGILNDLYKGKELDAVRNRRILSLFQLDFADPAVVRPDVAGRPIYLACAMNAKDILRIKPQNLLLNLPLASIS